MSNEQGYDVLRLIEHNQSCYISSEYVNGRTLIRYIREERTMEKEQLFTWMQKMAGMLGCVHKCRGAPCYQYVNPLSIIVSKEQELYFLDLQSQSNENMRLRMQKRDIREHFLPEEAAYYQQASVELDIYGLARTWQYVLAETEITPELTKKEIIKLEKIISRCLDWQSKKASQSAQEIKRMIPSYKNEEKEIEEKKNYRKPLCVMAAIVVAILVMQNVLAGDANSTATKTATANQGQVAPATPTTTQSTISAENEPPVAPTPPAATADQDQGAPTNLQTERELGSLYFLELEDYEKSRKHFEAAGKGTDREAKLSASLAAVAAALSEEPLPQEELLSRLEDATLTVEGKDDAIYYRCILKGYTYLELEEAREELVKLGTQYRTLGEKEGLEEVTWWMARAYEQNEKKYEAARIYEELLAVEGKKAEKEELYRKVTELYLTDDKTEEAMRVIRAGTSEYPEAMGLQVLKLRGICKEKENNRGAIKVAFQRTVKEYPAIRKNEDFKKVLQEQGFLLKGERICEKE